MLRFKLFGIPVEVHWFFWLIAAIIGHSFAAAGPGLVGPRLIVAVAMVFVSILAHELGHALMYRRYGGYPSIALYTMGGLTSSSGHFDRRRTILITAAGPALSLLLAALAFGAALAAGVLGAGALATFGLYVLMVINIFWSILNLLPVYPLDGGQILDAALGPQRRRATALTGVVIGGIVTLYALLPPTNLWLAMIFGALTYSNWQLSQGKRPTMF
jgi:Zn-dependent protease